MEPVMRKRGIYSVISALLVIGVTTLASLLYIDRMQFGNRLQGRYQKELYDLIGNVQNLESDLSKVSVSSSRQQSTVLFGDIWRQAGAAADRINSLPVTHSAISETSKFLSQVADFSYSLAKNNNGSGIKDGDMKNVAELKNNAAYLRNMLYSLQQEIEDGKITWSEVRYEGGKILGKANANLVDQKFTSIDKAVQKHPTLIYDGPFSENVLNIAPHVSSEPVITWDQAKEKVLNLFGKDRVQEIGSYSSKGDGRIAVYPFYVVLKNRDKNNPIDIDISKNGGHIVYMIDPRDVGSSSIDNKKAIDIGLNFLTKNVASNMVPTFSQKLDNVMVTNYVSTQSNGQYPVVIYPDQIKVKIAMDTGDIIGVEAEKYLTAHKARNLPKAKLPISQARAKVKSSLKISNTRLAVIPILSQREVFCYEFVGKLDNTTYVVYINAENGNEEDILQIIDTPGGQLAM